MMQWFVVFLLVSPSLSVPSLSGPSLSAPSLIGPPLSGPSHQCGLCTSALSELQVLYQDTESQDLISVVVGEVCDLVPIFDCVNYLEELLNSVSRQALLLDPLHQCAVLGACRSHHTHVSPACAVCAKGADLVISTLKNPTLERVVERVLKGLCAALRRGPQCDKTVDEYLTMILVVITMENLSGDTFCDWAFFNLLRVDCNFD